jgi:sugar lactone lactonase YvrE
VTLIAEGLTWPEAPRWRNGELWFSDVSSFRLMRIGRDGTLIKVCDVPGRPSGLAFTPDGRLLLATGLGRQLLWIAADGTSSLAVDLTQFSKSLLNDMVVDAAGRAYVGDTGFQFGSDEPKRPGGLIMFDESRGVRIVANDVCFPNGMAVTPDGMTLYLAETFGNRITAFDIEPEGELTNRRVHAMLESSPDGLCLDAEGALWVPLLFEGEFQRILPDGRIDQRIRFESRRAISCVLGGEDRRKLFFGVAQIDETDPKVPRRIGALYSLNVPIAGAGIP